MTDEEWSPPSPRVSVCMPASRPTRWFLEALDSVLAQDMADLEIVVTDDSGGNLRPLVASRADPRIRYERNSRPLGISGNHCRALDLASGEIIAFLHDDDAWRPDYLSSVLDVLASQALVGLVLVDMEEMDSGGASLGLRACCMDEGLQSDPLSVFMDPEFLGLIPSASVFRRSALALNSRPWPEVVAGDVTMYVDCVLAGWVVHHLARPLTRYRIHDGQTSSSDLVLQSALVTVWSSYSFTDARHEDARVRRTSTALIDRASARLRLGDARRAREDLRAVGRLSPGHRLLWRVLLLLLSRLPRRVFIELARLGNLLRKEKRGHHPR